MLIGKSIEQIQQRAHKKSPQYDKRVRVIDRAIDNHTKGIFTNSMGI